MVQSAPAQHGFLFWKVLETSRQGIEATRKKVESAGSIWQCVKTNSTPVLHIKIAGKWMFIPLKMVLIGIDPYPYKL